jgi:hypothetical protein
MKVDDERMARLGFFYRVNISRKGIWEDHWVYFKTRNEANKVARKNGISTFVQTKPIRQEIPTSPVDEDT